LSHDSKSITLDRKQLIREMRAPKTKEEILSFLGLAGYFRVWIPNYSLLAAPLYDATKGDSSEPLLTSIDTPFQCLQQALLQALALHLPDTQKPFTLYVHENKGLALGVLGQDKGPTFVPVAYLSKKLDPTVWGWGPCLRALSATYVLVQESKKLTFGGTITIVSPHHLVELLTYKGLRTLAPCWILSLLVSFLHDSSITLHACSSLNPATLLPTSTTMPTHYCVETLEALLPCPSHIQEGPQQGSTYTWFTDGSSYVEGGVWRAGYAIVSLTQTIEAQPLPPSTTNQQAELFAVTRAFELVADHFLTLYTDSKYVLHILLCHSAIWKERGLLTTRGTSVTNSTFITNLLRASFLPSKIGIAHCQSHQMDSSSITRGNSKADQAA
jgi:ribonuclease HI